MSEYKKVTGMTAGQVVDLYLEGAKFYTDRPFGSINDTSKREFEVSNLRLLNEIIAKDELYMIGAKPWWEGCEGSIIMVHGKREEHWYPIILARVDTSSLYPYKSNCSEYMYARPMTSKEHGAIKVKG